MMKPSNEQVTRNMQMRLKGINCRGNKSPQGAESLISGRQGGQIKATISNLIFKDTFND